MKPFDSVAALILMSLFLFFGCFAVSVLIQYPGEAVCGLFAATAALAVVSWFGERRRAKRKAENDEPGKRIWHRENEKRRSAASRTPPAVAETRPKQPEKIDGDDITIEITINIR